MSIAGAILKAPIYLYRWTLKPYVGWSCRHVPTCSEYALEAIDKNGAWRGFWLTVSRLLRCHPLGTRGHDPVPDIRKERHPFAPWRYGRWRLVAPQAVAPPRVTVKTITSLDGKRRVVIERYGNGCYGFEEEYFSEEPLELCWIPLGGDTFSLCDSAETAEREARGRIAWLKASAVP